jgi:hypothetical protein
LETPTYDLLKKAKAIGSFGFFCFLFRPLFFILAWNAGRQGWMQDSCFRFRFEVDCADHMLLLLLLHHRTDAFVTRQLASDRGRGSSTARA